MDPLTAGILNWDMSNLTQQQIEYLHAINSLATSEYAKWYMEQVREKRKLD